jgi:hypothetical protein
MEAKFFHSLLGNIEPMTFLLFLIWGMIGIFVNILIHASGRDVRTDYSPLQFSWTYLIKDNWKRGLLGIFLLIVSIRFSNEILGVETTAFASFWIGLTSHKLINIFRRLSKQKSI